MNDYFIWMNGRETDEQVIERTKVFGQSKFVKKNIGTIRNIMDTIAVSNNSVNDIKTLEFLDKLSDKFEVKGIDVRQFMFLLRKHNITKKKL